MVKKFYHEEGANLLIPADDMIVHEYNQNYKPRIDIEERQRKIREMQERKAAKIREREAERERKELEECSFAPQINRKKRIDASIMGGSID